MMDMIEVKHLLTENTLIMIYAEKVKLSPKEDEI